MASLTTSYPVCKNSASGVFVARLLDHLNEHFDITVVAPDCFPREEKSSALVKLNTFRYAPRRWEMIAHQPGGIPVALKNRPVLYLLVPVFLISMFVQFFLQARRADVLQANWAICGCIAGLCGSMLRRPVVTTIRGEDATRTDTSPIDRFIMYLTVRLSYRVVAVSPDILKVLRERYPAWRYKFVFIGNGVDDIFFSKGKNREFNQQDTTLRLVTVGSLIKRKGIDVLINALALLDESLEFQLTVIGAGEEQAELLDLTRGLGLEDRIEFSGSVTPERIPHELDAADVFVLASYSEGRPNVLLEAIASGLPVIGSDIPGIRELVNDGNCGLLFEAGDPAALARQITFILEHPDCIQNYSENARNHLRADNASWRATANRYARLYQEAS